MFVVPRPRMLVERVQFALWEQSAVGRRMIAEAEPEQHMGNSLDFSAQKHRYEYDENTGLAGFTFSAAHGKKLNSGFGCRSQCCHNTMKMNTCICTITTTTSIFQINLISWSLVFLLLL